jgi:hypothetical protein
MIVYELILSQPIPRVRSWIKALAGPTVPTPEQIATYNASHGMKTMDEGVFVTKFAKSVSHWVNTLANVRICAQQWPDSTPTHRP